jgi:murein tripeptide amidase MpaA
MRCVVLSCSITSSGVRNIVTKQDGVRNVVVISGRVHPGETPASHVVHGLMEFLLSSDASAAALRKLATWVIVPMLNPDGVSAGNYRCDAGVHTSPFETHKV